MTIIGCFHEDAQGSCSPMTDIGRSTDGDLVATYSDGHRVMIAAMGGKVPVLRHDVGDEPYVALTSGPEIVETDGETIREAFHLWISTAVAAVDMSGKAMRIHQQTREGLTLADSDGDMDTFAPIEDGRPLCAVWNGAHLYGFAYGGGTPLARANGRFVAAELDRVRTRLALMGVRLRGKWRVVAGEGERLGRDLTGVVAGACVQIGVQPAEPMPGDFNAEWVWLRVDAVKGDRVAATLLTDPCVFAISLREGDAVRFDRRDVFQVERESLAA